MRLLTATHQNIRPMNPYRRLGFKQGFDSDELIFRLLLSCYTQVNPYHLADLIIPKFSFAARSSGYPDVYADGAQFRIHPSFNTHPFHANVLERWDG